MDELIRKAKEKEKDYPRMIRERSEDLRKDIMDARKTFSIPTMLLKTISKNNDLRMSMLELVDVLPSLASSDEIHEHFDLIVGKECSKASGFIAGCANLFSKPVLKTISAKGLSWVIYKSLAPYFIVSPSKIDSMLMKHHELGMWSNLDFVGEAVVSEMEAIKYLDRYLCAISRYGKKHEKLNVSIKPSSLYAFFSPENYRESKRIVCDRLAQVLREAKKTNTIVTIDAEQNQFSYLIEDIFCTVIMETEFREMKNVGVALQAYRKNSMSSARMLVSVAEKRGTPFFIRLVKGAYWDSELAWSKQKSWDMPLFEKKEETDQNFISIASYLFENWFKVYVSPATHNPESIANMMILAKKAGVRYDDNFRFEALYGLGDPVCAALRRYDCRIVVYTPVGNLKEGMSYMVRRVLENTSNDGFLFELLK